MVDADVLACLPGCGTVLVSALDPDQIVLDRRVREIGARQRDAQIQRTRRHRKEKGSANEPVFFQHLSLFSGPWCKWSVKICASCIRPAKRFKTGYGLLYSAPRAAIKRGRGKRSLLQPAPPDMVTEDLGDCDERVLTPRERRSEVMAGFNGTEE